MTSNIGKLILISVLVTGITACKGKNKSQPPPNTPPVATPPPTNAPQTVAQRLGSVFSTIILAAATAEPRDPAPGDLNPVSLTTEPIDF